jgi:hypothetical protein
VRYWTREGRLYRDAEGFGLQRWSGIGWEPAGDVVPDLEEISEEAAAEGWPLAVTDTRKLSG